MPLPIDASTRPRRRFLGQLSAAGAMALAPQSLLAKDMDKKLGVALVGLGGYATGQLGPALRLTRHCRLAGVVTGSREKGLQWARDYGFAERSVYGYDSIARIADDPDIDIVYVVTPNSLHARHAIAAARAGKHVICEKPMGVSVAECDAIIAACKAAGVKLSIGYRLHFDPIHEELRRLARTREIGPMLTMSGAFAAVMQVPQWRARRELAGGGPLMDLGIYVVQAACMAAQAAPVAVTARMPAKRRPDFFADVEESLAWTMEFTDGARCTGFTSYNDRGNTFRAEAGGGWIEIKPAFNYNGLHASTQRGALDIAPAASQQALQMDDFAVCVRDGLPTRVAGEMGRRDLAIVEAIYASAAADGARTTVKT